jgi:hypothetical protein
MSYRLTKIQLESSIYYCGAGIDFQPILRFGDVVENFIYVTAGLTKNEFLNGIDEFIKNTHEELNKNDSSLEKISTSNISINEIEHPMSTRIIFGKPDYFSQNDYDNYLQSMRQFIDKKDEFHLEIFLILKMGNIEKSIRLFHLSGEALATYDLIYRRQNIAPKVFISIQTGLIEIPSRFSNRLFELSKVKPKIWLRGVWTDTDHRLDHMYVDSAVFNKNGIFNQYIGEYRNWQVLNSGSINSHYNSDKKYRIVKAYGESLFWNNFNKTSSFSKQGITINKILGGYDSASMSGNYNIVKTNFPLTKISEIVSEASEYYRCIKNSVENKVKVCIVPGGFECFEAFLQPFFESFLINLEWVLQIDIYYINKSDFNREF